MKDDEEEIDYISIPAKRTRVMHCLPIEKWEKREAAYRAYLEYAKAEDDAYSQCPCTDCVDGYTCANELEDRELKEQRRAALKLVEGVENE